VGSGFRTFTAGEVLTASNVQNYLMDQSVMVFGGSAARSSAIGTANFEEGMVSYLTDTDKVESYNGTNWVQVGSSNQGLTLINTTSFSGVSSQSINNVFSSTYQNYRIVLNAVGTHANPTTAGLDLRLRVGGVDNSANSYDFVYILRNDSAFASSITTNTVTTIAFMGDRRISSVVDVFSPAEAAFTNFVVNQFSKGTANTNGGITSGIHIVATAYDGFTMISGAGTMTGTVSVYGYNK
jgi:hypothetical protein